jgi:hypothetical protein
VPIVKATIGGREYSFAPLKYKQWEELADLEEGGVRNPTKSVRAWLPWIADSMKRAGDQMPDVREMDLDTANVVLGLMVKAVMKASGMEVVSGEEKPVGA